MNEPNAARDARFTACTLTLSIHNEPGALARVLLVFSRRRLRIGTLSFVDGPGRALPGELCIDLECDPRTARALPAELERIVEVVSVSSEAPAAGAAA